MGSKLPLRIIAAKARWSCFALDSGQQPRCPDADGTHSLALMSVALPRLSEERAGPSAALSQSLTMKSAGLAYADHPNMLAYFSRQL